MSNNHEKIAQRLAMILIKLNSGDELTLEELAEEFNVSVRTIRRDFTDRFSSLPIKKEKGVYSLEEYCLGKLNFEDIKNFSALCGIRNLYPNMSDDFIVDLLNSRVNQTYLIKGNEYEDVSSKSELFELLNVAIIKKQVVNLTYNNKDRELKPYKLINTDGIWYLSADENNKLKTYTLTKVSNASQSSKTFTPNKEFIEIISKNQDTWFSKNEIKVTLHIDQKVKDYFLRRDLLPHQTILKNNDDLVVSTKVSYEEEILKVVRHWMPHIKILEPLSLQTRLINGLKDYINS